MEFFKNFVNQVFSSMPVAAKVSLVNLNIKQYMKDLERDEIFCDKFTRIVKMFVRREISVQDMCDILDAADGIRLTHGQIEYFCNQVYYNGHIIHILKNFINYQHLTDEEISDLSQFLVKEIDNAIIVDK
ncbi:se83 [Alphabaculovirus alterspexiguae]|uniref:Se83 n=1 Tax=Spodoptera exigua multiple nucleopolyhedrovirus TaxID=10454 RepID=A0A3G2JU21_9ABAC|nr:se83 [Spodoptera exigua multiple nucleopolyhedrovirus]AYN45043.1 se83 [Spodoptera exigua multiple nucleopolyhedrovirus]